MALKDLFTMAKADRYTQDGREELMEARKAETEDRTYNIGEISEKTGLQKTANGWRPPKKGGAKTLKKADRNAYNKAVKNISTERLQEAFNKREGKELTPEAKAKHEIIKTELIKRDQIKKQADFEKKIGDPAKAREQYWKEIKESSENKPNSAEKHAKAMENAKKVGIVSKVPEGWKKAEGVTTAPNGYVAITNGGSRFPKEGQQKKEIKFIKEEDFNKGNTQTLHEKIPAIRKEEDNVSVKEADDFYKGHGFNKTGEKVNNVDGITVKEYKDAEGNTIYSRFNKEGRHYGSNFVFAGSENNSAPDLRTLPQHLEQETPQNTTITKEDEERFGKSALSGLSGSREPEQSKPATTKAPKPSVQEYMKAQDTVKKYDETYKKQLEEYENGQRLRANGGGAILDPMYGLKPNDLSKNEEYQKAKDIIQRMEAEDAAPRVLTGDTRIRIRK